jgi:hypothetical protein
MIFSRKFGIFGAIDWLQFERTFMDLSRRSRLLWKGLRQRLHPHTAPSQTLLIVGMQRSGTNMLMDAFDKSPNTQVFHDWDARAFEQYQLHDNDPIRQLTRHSRAHTVVFKTLFESTRTTDLLEQLQPARAIWLLRHYDDVVNSMVKSFGDMSAQLQKIVADPDSNTPHGRGISADTHAAVGAVHHAGMDAHNTAALLWYIRNSSYLNQGCDQRDDIDLILYEDIVSDPVNQIRGVFERAALPFSACMASHIHAHSVRRDQPSGLDTPVRNLCDDLWQHLQGNA